ncbi:MAG: PA14 domain-containing protein [Janthinobacterium lividum]
MNRYGWRFCGWLLAGLPASAQAQALVGDGLKGDYYEGLNFKKFVLTRHDAALDFNWHQNSPASGVPAEDFSVRWTGYLVPPATGHYVLHLTVDDGMRLWLNDRQLLNEWRGQSISLYKLEVDLKAGVPYALRIDYCQYGYDSRALLAWERPDKPADSSWRNLWGTASSAPPPEVIPTRYLFSHNPVAPVAPVPPPAPVAAAKPTPSIAPRPKPQVARRVVTSAPVAKPRRVSPVVVVPVSTPPHIVSPDSGRAAAVATRLAAGQAVTMRALHFEQGKAALLPSVQASLDTLAATLRQHPALRLEVQGHTDNQGDATLNRQLSQQRAEAVCHYLATHGVGAERLQPVGYGGSQPVADNRNLDLRAQNRRVVLRPLP